MLIIMTAILMYFLTLPGTYLIARSKLAKSLVELFSAGFFFGFGLLVMAYLGLCRVMPVSAADTIVVLCSVASLVFLVKEIHKNPLPVWDPNPTKTHYILIGLSLLFMTVLALGDMGEFVDDDAFIHLPNIRRVAMGDIPLHMAYFPDVFLRGHPGRDMLIGTLTRMLSLRPELAVIYSSLASLPIYILMFYVAARRLARSPISTAFCFVGLLYLVSFAIGEGSIRAGCITYVFNNNILAYSHLMFMAWLIERLSCAFADGGASAILKRPLLITIAALSWAGLYFIYISNFLMISLFALTLPIQAAVIASRSKRRALVGSSCVLMAIGVMTLAIHMLVSPLLMERVLVSLNACQFHEPIGWTQQGRLTFPKAHLFTITDTMGDDIPFFRRKTLLQQGPSFYLGIAGLFIGLAARRWRLAAASLFAWLVMLWMLLVDMGEFRAETLRLLLIAHMACGAATGMMTGELVERVLQWLRSAAVQSKFRTRAWCLACCQAVAILLPVSAFAWMGRGNAEKFIEAKHYDIATSFKKMRAIHRQNPEHWLTRLNVPSLDYQAIQCIHSLIRSPKQRVMLRITPDFPDPYRNAEDWRLTTAELANTAFMTGAGLVGVCQDHGPVRMGRFLFPYGYRASIFWNHPSADLLQQLGPDWILLDPKRVSGASLKTLLAYPQVELYRTFSDGNGDQRLLLHCRLEPSSDAQITSIQSIDFGTPEIHASHASLVKLPVMIKPDLPAEAVKLQLLVLDPDGECANTMDTPIVPIEKTGPNKYKLYLTMIQPGRWKVHFVQPGSQTPINKTPLVIGVDETLAAHPDKLCRF